jgi:hypothetical protein
MVLYFLCHLRDGNKYPKEMLDMNIASDYGKIGKQFNINNRNANLKELDALVQNNEVSASLTRSFSLQKKFDRDDFISLLFYGGILTIDKSVGEFVTLKMPNQVLEKLYLEFFVREIAEKHDVVLELTPLRKAIFEMSQNGDITPFVKLVESLLQSLSFRDFQKFEEKYVKAIIYSYISLSQLYLVKSEYELPKGYADLVLFKRSPFLEVKHQFLFELKYSRIKDGKAEKNIDALVKEAERKMADYIESPEIQERLNDESCPLQPYILVFVGPECKKVVAGG